MLYDRVFDFVQVMGEIKLTLQGVGVTQKNLFLSLDLWCKDLVPKKEDEIVLDNRLSSCADRVFDFVQEMGGIKLTLQGVGVTQKNLFLSLDLWFKDLVPQKEGKTISNNGLSLCADQVFDFVQEMGYIKLHL